jgi:UDP-N-acetylmuramyl pentapeptide phosphotransferase/UDP-N-acetylglucosamine-1-phosphate transferase
MATLVQIAALAAVAAIVSSLLIVLLLPILARYALAKPNPRSSHALPTPQGGGIAVVAGTIVAVMCAVVFAPELIGDHRQLAIVFAATIGLAVVGVSDDVRPMEALPRLALQALAVGVVVVALPADLRIVPTLPWWLERFFVVLGGVWFVNVVNFMDGIDWMTVAEVVPLTAALGAFGLMGALPRDATLVSFVLCGAMVGFAPFNRPVARLFLGDVGSLPVGLLLGWLLLMLATKGHCTAAFLLPLYYLADATITLFLRTVKGEPVTQAHRSHFYQQAVRKGLPVAQVVGRVFALNIVLAGLAALMLYVSAAVQLVLVVVAIGLVGALLWSFSGQAPAPPPP